MRKSKQKQIVRDPEPQLPPQSGFQNEIKVKAYGIQTSLTLFLVYVQDSIKIYFPFVLVLKLPFKTLVKLFFFKNNNVLRNCKHYFSCVLSI